MHRRIPSCVLLTVFVWLTHGNVFGQQPLVSSHFQIRGMGLSESELGSVLKQCEEARRELTTTWNVLEHEKEWLPKCDIHVHRYRNAYINAVGIAASQTDGCSSVQVDNGKVVGRRIDLLIGQQGHLPALKHELTHVVIADRFQGQPPPHWFDEGIAMLADNREKQSLHLRDCFEAVNTRRSIPLDTLLSLEGFTSPDQMAPFYGQSLTLVAMLTEKRPASVLVSFALDAKVLGYSAALRKHYAIDDLQSLEKEWLAYVQHRRVAGHPIGFGPSR